MPKRQNKILWIVLVALLLVLAFSQFFGGKKERNFKTTLVTVDSAQVTRLAIRPKSVPGATIEVERDGNSWKVSKGNLQAMVKEGVVKNMLTELLDIKAARLAARKKEKWKQYEVTDSLGTAVEVYDGETLLTSFTIGKFNFQPAARKAMSFIRLGEEEEVYAIDGFIGSSFDKDFDKYRDNTLLKLDKEALTEVRFDYPNDSSFTLSKQNSSWYIAEATLDSAAWYQYLQRVTSMLKSDFVNDFTPSVEKSLYRVAFSGKDIEKVTVNCYRGPDSGKLILHSSQNQAAYFLETEENCFEELLVSKSALLKQQ